MMHEAFLAAALQKLHPEAFKSTSVHLMLQSQTTQMTRASED